jgi:hypothetical protein
MASPGLSAHDHTQLTAAPATSRKPLSRRVALWGTTVGAVGGSCVGAGMLLEHTLDGHGVRTWHLTDSGLGHALVALVDAMSLIGGAVVFSIIIMTLLLWRSGKRLMDKAETYDENLKAHKIIATTILVALRVSRPPTIFDDLRGDSTEESGTRN